MFPEEPSAADPRLLRTLHIAGASKQTAEKAAKIAAEEIRRYHMGKPLQNGANPACGGRSHPVACGRWPNLRGV